MNKTKTKKTIEFVTNELPEIKYKISNCSNAAKIPKVKKEVNIIKMPKEGIEPSHLAFQTKTLPLSYMGNPN